MDMTDMMVMGTTGFKIALVVHIAGALLLFAAIGLQTMTTFLLRFAATVGQVKTAAAIGRRLPALFGPASGLIVLSGLYMGYLDWHSREAIGWIIVSLVLFIAISIFGSVTGRRLQLAVAAALGKSDGRMSEELKQVSQDNRPVFQLCASVAAVFGILVVMIFQPGTLVAILILLAALGLGCALYSLNMQAGRLKISGPFGQKFADK